MAVVNSGFRTIQSETFDDFDDEEVEVVADGSHRKFIALVVLVIVVAASFATLFAVVS